MSERRRAYERSLALLARARRVVPGASQTLSKGPQMFVEGAYPVFLERGSGCRVWDVDGHEYVDWILGLASITLGYAYPAVVEAVAAQARQGSIFSLPHPLEVEVAERLTQLIPCAEMVRFLKTGSEANAAVVRVARAATGRDIVLYCGYSGWHDWYAITTSRSKGIPKDFARFIVAFDYNDLPSLERALDEHHGQVAAVIMEPVLLDAPTPGFLEGVKAAAHRHGALLIFDEIVSGFRWAQGGAQEHFGVVPDLATFGKGMANGLPLAAVVGRAELMREFEDVFVSSTFGGDTLALAAARATLDEYARQPVIEHLWRMGRRFQEGFRRAAERAGVPAECVGYPVHPKIGFLAEREETRRLVMSLFLQETARRGVLFHFAGFNVSFSHREADVDQTLDACGQALGVVAQALGAGRIAERLEGKPYQEAFRRSLCASPSSSTGRTTTAFWRPWWRRPCAAATGWSAGTTGVTRAGAGSPTTSPTRHPPSRPARLRSRRSRGWPISAYASAPTPPMS
jgi:glutamate-1-semialdehyde aminotransferase